MIRTSHMVSCMLPLVLLAVSFFGVHGQCLASGVEKQAIDVGTAFSDELFEWQKFKFSQRQTNECSSIEIIKSWWRFTSHPTHRAAKVVLDRATSLGASCQQWQVGQQKLVLESLNLSAKRCREDLEQLASTALTWLPTQHASDETDLSTDGPTDEGSAEQQEQHLVDQLVAHQSAYWVYYQDCERWGVELTQTVQHVQMSRAANPIESSDRATDESGSSAVEQKMNISSGNRVMQQMSQWFHQALRQIEFASIESRVASRTDVVTESE